MCEANQLCMLNKKYPTRAMGSTSIHLKIADLIVFGSIFSESLIRLARGRLMSECLHLQLLQMQEFIHNKKRTKEFVCEDCLSIFQPCPVNDEIPRTSEHSKECGTCNIRGKRNRVRMVQDTWQEKLLEYNKPRQEEKNKKKSHRS